MVFDKEDGNCYILSTGKAIHAKRGILGLSPDLDITYGYDGGLFLSAFGAFDPELTQEEVFEIALYMSDKWGKLADQSFAATEEARKLGVEFIRLNDEEQRARAFFSGE